MIRFIHCMKARPGVGLERFREFWHGAEFKQLLSELEILAGTRRIRRSLTLQVEANEQLRVERGARPPHDAVLEIWFDDAISLQRLAGDEATRDLLQRMEALQSDYVDFQASTRFFTEWLEES